MAHKPKVGTPAFGKRAAQRRASIFTKMTPKRRRRDFGDLGVADVVSGKKIGLGARRKRIEKALKH